MIIIRQKFSVNCLFFYSCTIFSKNLDIWDLGVVINPFNFKYIFIYAIGAISIMWFPLLLYMLVYIKAISIIYWGEKCQKSEWNSMSALWVVSGVLLKGRLPLSGLRVRVSGVWWSQSQPGAEEDVWYPAEHRQNRSSHLKLWEGFSSGSGEMGRWVSVS